MAKKINDPVLEVLLTKFDDVNNNIKEVKTDVKKFRDDAEKKLNDSRKLNTKENDDIKKDIKDKFNLVKKEVFDLKVEIEKIKDKNEIIAKHDVKIGDLESEMKVLGKSFHSHLEEHKKGMPDIIKLRLIIIGIGIITVSFLILVGTNVPKLFKFIMGLL